MALLTVSVVESHQVLHAVNEMQGTRQQKVSLPEVDMHQRRDEREMQYSTDTCSIPSISWMRLLDMNLDVEVR